jgi:hypothetical protein
MRHTVPLLMLTASPQMPCSNFFPGCGRSTWTKPTLWRTAFSTLPWTFCSGKRYAVITHRCLRAGRCCAVRLCLLLLLLLLSLLRLLLLLLRLALHSSASVSASGGISSRRFCRLTCSAGMRDACVESCLRAVSSEPVSSDERTASTVLYSNSTSTHGGAVGMDTPLRTWSTQSSDPLSRCMQQHCAATEPTSYNPEVRCFNVLTERATC